MVPNWYVTMERKEQIRVVPDLASVPFQSIFRTWQVFSHAVGSTQELNAFHPKPIEMELGRHGCQAGKG